MVELKYCNCADCGVLLLGRCHLAWWHSQPDAYRRDNPIVQGRAGGRPYCSHRLHSADPRCERGRVHTPERGRDTPPPSWDNAVRAVEGD